MRGDVIMRDGRQTTNEQLKIELLSQWKLEAESHNFQRESFMAKDQYSKCDYFDFIKSPETIVLFVPG